MAVKNLDFLPILNMKSFVLYTYEPGQLNIVTGYRLDDWDMTTGRCRNFSLCHRIQTVTGAHPDSCPVGTGCYYPGVKAAEALISPLTSV
jgi:hypothetical protein